MKMKIVTIGAVFSIILNIGLIIHFLTFSPFFQANIQWLIGNSVKFGGVLEFSDKKLQPNPKEFVQFYQFNCVQNECNGVELTLLNREIISSRLFRPEIKRLSYTDKEVILSLEGCDFFLRSENSGFVCLDKGEQGKLSNHVMFYYQ